MKLAIIGIGLMAWLTWQRSTLYQSDEALWGNAIQTAPTFRAYVNYRNGLLAHGKVEAAIGLCDQLWHTAGTPPEIRMLFRLCFGWPSSP